MKYEDISPVLLEKIKTEFRNQIINNSFVKAITRRIQAGDLLDYEDASRYATEVGEALAAAFKRCISPQDLPDGKMYYNIAEKVVKPMLIGNYEMIVDVAQKAQESLNKAIGIKLKAKKPKLDEDRVERICQKVASDKLDKTAWILDEGVIIYSMSVVDEAVKINAQFHHDAGLTPTLTRKMAGDCCEWCSNLAGTFEYGEHPKDIFRRHRYCRCTVVFKSEKGYQSVHDRKYYATEHEAEIAERKVKIKADEKAIEKERKARHIADYYKNKN